GGGSSHAAPGVIEIQIQIPKEDPARSVLTEAQKLQLKLDAQRQQLQERKSRAMDLRARAAERRAARLTRNVIPITPSIWDRVKSGGMELRESLWKMLRWIEGNAVSLEQSAIGSVRNGWHSLIASGQTLAHSIASRFDVREQMTAMRTSMEKSLTKYSTALKNDNGRLVLAQLKITLLSPDGSPYTNAPVVLFSDPQSAVTDSNGTVIFQNVEVREHRLEIHTFKGDVQQRKISLTASAPASAVGKKGVVVSIPEVRIVVDETNTSPFGRLSPLFFALWSLGILAIGTGGGMYVMYRHFAQAKRRR
ncbi:MAG: hypothetical protein WCG83_07175, partial [Candidatus Peregrinibacteria bacterium]